MDARPHVYRIVLDTRRITNVRSGGRFQVNPGIRNPEAGSGLFVADNDGMRYLTHSGRFNGWNLPNDHPFARRDADEAFRAFHEFSVPSRWISVKGEENQRYLVTPIDVPPENVLRELKQSLDEVVAFKALTTDSHVNPPLNERDSVDFSQLANELFIDPDSLRRMETLLGDKRQIIIQGPPGTGKTYVARKLAACLAGDVGNITFVQFHPSYSYEDFIQGLSAQANSQATWIRAETRSTARGRQASTKDD